MHTVSQGIVSGRRREGLSDATSNFTQQKRPAAASKTSQAFNQRQLHGQHHFQRASVCNYRNVDIWAATNLEILNLHKTNPDREDILHENKNYRRLSPDYFLWLQKRFFNFRQAVEKKLVDGKTETEVANRFGRIQLLAERYFSPHDFDTAKFRLSLLPMLSPNKKEQTFFIYPTDKTLPVFNPISSYALKQVDAVKHRAISLGWTESGLYQNQGTFTFPYGFDWGIINFIDRGDRLGEVTSKTIELITATGSVLHFYKHGNGRRHQVGLNKREKDNG